MPPDETDVIERAQRSVFELGCRCCDTNRELVDELALTLRTTRAEAERLKLNAAVWKRAADDALAALAELRERNRELIGYFQNLAGRHHRYSTTCDACQSRQDCRESEIIQRALTGAVATARSEEKKGDDMSEIRGTCGHKDELDRLRARIEWDDWLIGQIRTSPATKGAINRTIDAALGKREEQIEAMLKEYDAAKSAKGDD